MPQIFVRFFNYSNPNKNEKKFFFFSLLSVPTWQTQTHTYIFIPFPPPFPLFPSLTPPGGTTPTTHENPTQNRPENDHATQNITRSSQVLSVSRSPQQRPPVFCPRPPTNDPRGPGGRGIGQSTSQINKTNSINRLINRVSISQLQSINQSIRH